jgi:quercetin dioxygenase-like cupin family protein
MAGLIRNLTELRWGRMAGGIGWRTRPEEDERWEQIGMAVCALESGEALAMYHREDGQEDFLVVSGEGTLLVDGEERRLRQWDFFHCPPGTAHAIVGGPLVVVAVGVRPVRGLSFPADDLARQHGYAVEEETDDPALAFARFGEPERGPYKGWLE